MYWILLLLTTLVYGQQLINGQLFTKGLAIVDSPQPWTTFRAGASYGLAIDVSADGRLGNNAGIDFLEIYLTSNTLNITVSQGPGILIQEPGSTVKHLNTIVPSCVLSGNYNMTIYEKCHTVQGSYFSITPIPVTVVNEIPGGLCLPQSNELFASSQPDSPCPPAFNPALPQNAAPTVTYTQSGMITSSTGTPAPTSIVTVTLQGGESIVPTLTVQSGQYPSVTVVYVSLQTTLTTEPGQTQAVSTTLTKMMTITQALVPTQKTNPGFVPVNAASRSSLHLVFLLPFLWLLW